MCLSCIAYEVQNTTVVPATVFNYITQNRVKHKDNISHYRHAHVYFCNFNRKSPNTSDGNKSLINDYLPNIVLNDW